jgi:tetratricopeptide (TPR) repeat protein
MQLGMSIWPRNLARNSKRNPAIWAGWLTMPRALTNYAINLARIGRYQQACDVGLSSLDLHRPEPDYARSLSNYASHLSKAGQNEEALEHACQTLEIHKRLVQKNPDRFADAFFSNICFAHFLAWLCDQGDGSEKPDLNEIAMFVPSHRRPLLLLYSAFVEGCAAADRAARAETFGRVLSHWSELSMAHKTQGEGYWLCAAAWCATFESTALVEHNWKASWEQFRSQRHGRIPDWMLQVARRLKFQWPE